LIGRLGKGEIREREEGEGKGGEWRWEVGEWIYQKLTKTTDSKR
jgi:hypothetical protein